MIIFSDAHKDVKTPDKGPGGYEWWYFDAVDEESGTSVVIIFYEGNPFSRRYAQALQKEPGNEPAFPAAFPAVSISVYQDGEPVYYSFTEYEPDDALFGSEVPNLKIDRHSMIGEVQGEQLKYNLHLEEELPSGDAIYADLTFQGGKGNIELQKAGQRVVSNDISGGHRWNMVQPRAEVSGSINLTGGHRILFRGTGYHDHNTGFEPMKEEYRDWYWGRYHFPDRTLVYYIMNRQNGRQHRAWLLDHKGEGKVQEFREAGLADFGLSVFGLNSARQITFNEKGYEVTIQQSHVLDNGPFYQRFSSEAFLKTDEGEVLKSTGLSEYIHPERIYWKIFWPLVNMRIHYKQEGPHWVQRSKKLYRWTW